MNLFCWTTQTFSNSNSNSDLHHMVRILIMWFDILPFENLCSYFFESPWFHEGIFARFWEVESRLLCITSKHFRSCWLYGASVRSSGRIVFWGSAYLTEYMCPKYILRVWIFCPIFFFFFSYLCYSIFIRVADLDLHDGIWCFIHIFFRWMFFDSFSIISWYILFFMNIPFLIFSHDITRVNPTTNTNLIEQWTKYY